MLSRQFGQRVICTKGLRGFWSMGKKCATCENAMRAVDIGLSLTGHGRGCARVEGFGMRIGSPRCLRAEGLRRPVSQGVVESGLADGDRDGNGFPGPLPWNVAATASGASPPCP